MARLRTLCLHSFRMNAAFFKWQLTQYSNLGQLVADDLELVFLDGPHRCSPQAEAAIPPMLRELCPDGPPPCHEWWNSRTEADGSITYDKYRETLEYIDAFVRREGPFAGVLGFSQGGMLAHLLCMLDREGRAANAAAIDDAAGAAASAGPGLAAGGGLPQPEPLRFGIFLSARTVRAASHAELLRGVRERPLTLPSLVVYGGKDTDVPPETTRAMIEGTLHPSAVHEVCIPSGGHKVPPLSPEDAAKCREFLRRVRAGCSL